MPTDRPTPPDAGDLVVVSHLDVGPDGVPGLRDAFDRRLGLVDAWDGFHGLEVWEDVRRPGRFAMVTRWADQDTFARYMRSRDHDRSHARVPDDPGPWGVGVDRYRLVAR
jgi:heme-degrading monooxygenase HmoA